MALEVRIISDPAQISNIPSWPIPPIVLQAGQPGVDLKPTMPAGIPTGGAFGTDAPLPQGLSLTTDGVLASAVNTPAGTFTGIKFTYHPPTIPAA